MSCSRKDCSSVKAENDLRICLRKEPISLDPRKGNDVVASQLHFMLFEGLFCLNPDMSLSLGQAKSYTISPNGKTYVFHLQDTFWSDGIPVTAYDFETSWKSILDPAFPSPDAYLLFPIKNAKMAKQGKVSLDHIGIYSKDPKTLIVELEAPTPYFLQILASSVLLPIPAHQEVAEPNWASRAELFFSNGPFQLKKWEFNQQLILEKNPHFARADDVKLDRIFIDIIDADAAVLQMYEKGYYDLVGSPLCFFPIELLNDLKAKQLLTFFPVAATKFLAFNTTHPFLKNVNIRRALSYAISRTTVVEHITRLNEKEAFNIIPPVLLSENSVYFSDDNSTMAREHFQQGLKELHIEDLPSLSFMYAFSETNHILAQELQQVWSRVLGIEVELKHMDFKTLHDCAKKGEFSIGLFAWLADYGDPMSILSRFIDKTSHRNYSKWENEGYNHVIEEALTIPFRMQYLEKIKEAEKILVDQMPLTCLFHENFVFLLSSHIQNFAISPLGHIYFDKIYIDRSK